MMQFNPLFFNISQPAPEICTPVKLNNVSYLFADIIQVLLGENTDLNTGRTEIEEPGEEIASVINAFNEIGQPAHDEDAPEKSLDNELIVRFNENCESPLQKIFAGTANFILQNNLQLSVMKNSGETSENFLVISDISEAELKKSFSLFINKVNEYFSGKGDLIVKKENEFVNTSAGSPKIFTGSQLNLFSEENPALTVPGNSSPVKFKLESTEEIFTLEFSKKIKASVFKNTDKLFVQEAETHPAKEFSLNINYSKLSKSSEKPLFQKHEEDIRKFIFPESENLKVNDYSFKKAVSSVKQDTLITLDNGQQKNPPEVKIFKKELQQIDQPDIEHTVDSVTFKKVNSNETAKENREKTDFMNRPASNPKSESPVILSVEISGEKISLKEFKESIRKVQHSEARTFTQFEPAEEKSAETDLTPGKNPDDSKDKTSFMKSAEDDDALIQKYISDTGPETGKHLTSKLNNVQLQPKDTITKTNFTLPSYNQQEIRIVSYSNLTEELTGIIKESEAKSVVLKLHPEELGKVKVVLDMADNTVKASIEVTNEAVKQTVQSGAEQLRQNLLQHGIQLSSLNVTLNDNQQKPNKTFDSKKQRHNGDKPEDKINHLPENEAAVKKLGYNTYEYLI